MTLLQPLQIRDMSCLYLSKGLTDNRVLHQHRRPMFRSFDSQGPVLKGLLTSETFMVESAGTEQLGVALAVREPKALELQTLSVCWPWPEVALAKADC